MSFLRGEVAYLFPRSESQGWEVGDMKLAAYETPSYGWLSCHGQSLNTSDYPLLFAKIGYTYGGSGSTFNLPNFNRRAIMGAVPAGEDTNEKWRIGKYGGAVWQSGSNKCEEVAAHDHTVSVTEVDVASGSGASVSLVTSPTGGTKADITPPYQTATVMIRYL